VQRLLALGVRGWVSKWAPLDTLLLAVQTIAQGHHCFPAAAAPPAEAAHFTPREREVLSLLALAYHNAEIAQALSLSLKTVETHLAHIFQKLGAHSRVEAVRRAEALGLVEPDRAVASTEY
jgi:DNA-binding NarL/FixJ family response regulator